MITENSLFNNENALISTFQQKANNALTNVVFQDPGIDLNNFDKEAEIAKFEDIEAPLWQVVIRLYTAPPKTKGGIILTESTRAEEQYKNIVGLVVKIGDGCYKDKRYEHTGPACKVGDWVVIARHSGLRMEYKGLPIFCTKEDGIELIVKNPTDIQRN